MTIEAPQAKKLMKFDCWEQTPILDEIHAK